MKKQYDEPVPKLIDYALTRTVLGQVLAVFQVFNLTELQISRLLSQNFSFGKASDYFNRNLRRSECKCRLWVRGCASSGPEKESL
jgi:hypothetical protein